MKNKYNKAHWIEAYLEGKGLSSRANWMANALSASTVGRANKSVDLIKKLPKWLVTFNPLLKFFKKKNCLSETKKIIE